MTDITTKAFYRRKLLAQRRKLPTQYIQYASEQVTIKLEQILHHYLQKMTAFYWPYQGEVDPRFFVQQHQQGFFCLPKVISAEQPMEFYHYQQQLLSSCKKKKNLHLTENFSYSKIFPNLQEYTPKIIVKVNPDIVLVPIVGYTLNKYRLGMGKGCYDRTLAQLKKQNPTILSIGLAYSWQLLPSLELEIYDQPLDFIVTEQEILS